MTPTTLATRTAEPEAAAPVAWEPCASAQSAEVGAALCDACGWPVDDHTPVDNLPAAA
ncbi:MAG TPA: hypothetical protein VLV81_02975 [Acidimicrobiia bacterium]|nr:hypothetical protein [Acidimicrobiia bacterium]